MATGGYVRLVFDKMQTKMKHLTSCIKGYCSHLGMVTVGQSWFLKEGAVIQMNWWRELTTMLVLDAESY